MRRRKFLLGKMVCHLQGSYTWPRDPQLFTSVWRLTQFPEQEKVPGRHDAIVVSTT
jgi:hypothetical protein